MDMPWNELDLAPTTDERAIRRAYAARLKLTRPEDDGPAFARLREAYEHALAWARWQASQEEEGEVAQPSTGQDLVDGDMPPSANIVVIPPESLDAVVDEPVDAAILSGDLPVKTKWQRDQPTRDLVVLALQRAAFDANYPDDALAMDAKRFGWLEVDYQTTAPTEWLARARYRVYHLQARRAIASVAQALQVNEDQALTCLQEQLAAPEWDVLDAKAVFEQGLSTWLLEQASLPMMLTVTAADWFAWRHADGYPRPGLSFEANSLCRQLQSAAVWWEWQQLASQVEPDRFRRSIFAAVVKPVSAWQRWLAAHSRKRVVAVRLLLDEIEYGYPDLFARLDGRNVLWWRQHWAPWAPQYLLGWVFSAALGLLAGAAGAAWADSHNYADLGWLAFTLAMLVGGSGALYGGNLLAQVWSRWLAGLGMRQPRLQHLLGAGFKPASLAALWLAIGTLLATPLLLVPFDGWPVAGLLLGVLGWSAHAAIAGWPERVLPPMLRRALAGGLSVIPSLIAAVIAGVMVLVVLRDSEPTTGICAGLLTFLVVCCGQVYFYARRPAEVPAPIKVQPTLPSQTKAGANWWWVVWVLLAIARFAASSSGHS